MICNNSFYSGSRHTCRPFPFYVQRLTAHGLSTDDTHGSRAVDIMCNGSGSVTVDDHATDTMTGTAHMLRAVRSERVKSNFRGITYATKFAIYKSRIYECKQQKICFDWNESDV